jgi:hypothetical protein
VQAEHRKKFTNDSKVISSLMNVTIILRMLGEFHGRLGN